MLAAYALPGFSGEESESRQDLGFWDLGVSNFESEVPIVVKSPVPGNGADFYYVWPFRFRNSISLVRVLDHMRSMLAKTGKDVSDEERRALIQRLIAKLEEEIEIGPNRSRLQLLYSQLKKMKTANNDGELQDTIERVKSELEHAAGNVKMRVSLIANEGSTSHDISSELIRNLALPTLIKGGIFREHWNGRPNFLTTMELATRSLAKDEIVLGVAIFPEIDPRADAFEIRVSGLGRRIVPSYYPGHLMKLGLPYDAKLRKVFRFFYTRPGDQRDRHLDDVYFSSRKSEWIWLWASEIYPRLSEEIVIERSQGLKYLYRYIPYEVFNSTPDPQELRIIAAGLAPQVEWHGCELVVKMVEDATTQDFHQSQAVRKLRTQGVADLKDDQRHVSGVIEPGRLAKGVAVVRWGVSDPRPVLAKVIDELRLSALTGVGLNRDDALVKKYLELWGPENDTTSILDRKPLPSNEVVRKLVIDQAAGELAGNGLEVSEADSRRYNALAPFAVLLNELARVELERLEKESRIPMVFRARSKDVTETARIVKLTNVGRPKERDLDLTIKPGEIKPVEETVPEPETDTGVGDTGAGQATDTGGGQDAGGAVDLW